jgi:hypothetical protein
MALTEAQIFGTAAGKNYVFGFAAANAPSITAFTARKASTDCEPEVYTTATDGEGHVEAVAVSLPSKRKISLSLEGYITAAFNELTVAGSFTFLGRFFIIKKINKPINKGEFVSVTIDAESFAAVVS